MFKKHSACFFFDAPPINSLGYVIGCDPLTADLLITIKSLSGALYFDLSLHNIKGLYIKGGTKMIRLIRRDQRKMGNNWKTFHWYFQSKKVGNYGLSWMALGMIFFSPFQQLKVDRSHQNKLILKKKYTGYVEFISNNWSTGHFLQASAMLFFCI